MSESKYKYNPEKEKSVFTQKLQGLFDETKKTQQELIDFIKFQTGKAPTRQAVSMWLHGNCPDIKTVPIIAKFFGVSTDYLLTETDIRPLDGNLSFVCEYTGLSAKSISNIVNLTWKMDDNEEYKNILNNILTSPIFGRIIIECSKIKLYSELAQNLDINLKSYDNIDDILNDCEIILAAGDNMIKVNEMNEKIDVTRYKLLKNLEKLIDIFDYRAEKEVD